MASGELELHVNRDNRDPRAACVLLIDTSSSMAGARIEALEEGFAQFVDEIGADPLARKRTEIAVVTFATTASVHIPFAEGRDIAASTFVASGSTNLAAGIDLALDLLETRKAEYRSAGIEYFRPWLFVLTDGEPDRGQALDAAIERLNRVERERKVTVFGVGVGDGVDFTQLRRLSTERVPLALTGLRFSEMFVWLSASMSRVSASAAASIEGGSDLDDSVQLTPPGWGSVR